MEEDMENMAERLLEQIGQRYEEMISAAKSLGAKHIHYPPVSGMSGDAGDDLIFKDGSKLTIGFYSEFCRPPYSDEIRWRAFSR